MKRDSFFQLYDLTEEEYSWKGLGLIAILYFGSMLFSAVVALAIFKLVHLLDPDASSYLAGKPFSDYFDRGRLLCLLILFPYLMKKADLLSWRRLGYLEGGWGHFKKWFVIGVGMMACVYLVDFAFGILEPRDDWTWGRQLEKIGLGLGGAVLIGLLEETFFRGFVFRTFYTALRPVPAIIGSSLFFAYLHFKMADEVMEHIPPAQIGFDDSLVAIWGTLTAFTTGFDALLFFNLFLVGILLSLAFLFTKNLWTCVGLHAGWVVCIQSLFKTVNEVEGAHPFFGTERVADGYLVTLFLIGFIGLFIWLMKKRSATVETEAKISS